MADKTQGWGQRDEPVTQQSGGWGANDTPVGGPANVAADPGEKPVSFSRQGLSDFGHTMARPFQEMYGGAKEAITGSFPKGANQILAGAGRIVKPMAIGASLPFAWEAPAAAAVGLGTSALGSMGGGALARMGAHALGASPDTEELAGTTGEGIGGLAGGIGGALGERALGRSAASGLRNIALGTTRKARAFDTNPGEASLKETKGILPERIAASAKQRLAELNPAYERTVELGSDVPLATARSVASRATGEAARIGSPTLASQVRPMEMQLQGNQVTGSPYPATVPPRQALDILRGFNEEQGAPNPLRTNKAAAFSKNIGGTLRDSIREAAPGSEELATRMHNLIPVEQLATRQETAPGMVESGVGRLTRPTGGLLPLIAGLTHGGLPGGGAVLAAQEALSKPAITSAMGRALWRLHGGERLGVPEMPQGPLRRP